MQGQSFNKILDHSVVKLQYASQEVPCAHEFITIPISNIGKPVGASVNPKYVFPQNMHGQRIP